MHFDTLKGWLDWQETLHPKSIDLGLERVAQVRQRLTPGNKQPITITVAGTNGKGSSIAFLDAIYRAQGLRVGAYTSPHITQYNERIKINGIPVSDDLICTAFTRIEAVRENISLSYFEFSTLAALDIFARADLDIQLLEVGLGGRLDAVNIIDPDATLVTSISLDHTAWLGKTREAIGFEKAGIFRPHITAIISDPQPPQSLIEQAHKIHAPIARIGHEFGYQQQTSNWSWHSTEQQLNALPLPQLKGTHQYRNAAAVLMAIQTLQNKIPVSIQAIKQGLQTAYLPGRFQVIQTEPTVLLDVSHNAQAAQALADYLQAAFPTKPVHAVFTLMNDKDKQGVIMPMQAIVKHWYISPLHNPRASQKEDLAEAFRQCNIPQVSFHFNDFISTFQAAKTNAQNDNGLVLVFGSFFLVSEYLNLFSDLSGK